MARHSGSNCAVEISHDGGTNWVAFGCFRDWNINTNRERFDATCGGDANKQYVVGKKDFTGSGTFVFDDANDEVFDAVDGSDPVLLRLYPNKVSLPLYRWQGLMYVDTSLTVGNDTITGSVNFAAAGDITRTTS
jgi:hypothetical protein